MQRSFHWRFRERARYFFRQRRKRPAERRHNPQRAAAWIAMIRWCREYHAEGDRPEIVTPTFMMAWSEAMGPKSPYSVIPAHIVHRRSRARFAAVVRSFDLSQANESPDRS